MQKKLMLRPSAVPTENLPPEITDLPYIDRPDSPDTSSSFISLDHSDSSTAGVNVSTPIMQGANSNNIIITNNNNIISNNNNINNNIIIKNNLEQIVQDEVKLGDQNFSYQTYQPATPIQTAVATPVNFQPSSYETLTTLSTVPFSEINPDQTGSYTLYDGTEIDRHRLSSVLNKDDYQDGTITFLVNFVDF
jgi:hypothetical protein